MEMKMHDEMISIFACNQTPDHSPLGVLSLRLRRRLLL